MKIGFFSLNIIRSLYSCFEQKNNEKRHGKAAGSEEIQMANEVEHDVEKT